LVIQPTTKGKSTWYDFKRFGSNWYGDGAVLTTSAGSFGTPIRIKNNPYAGSGFWVHVKLMKIPEVQNDAIEILANSP